MAISVFLDANIILEAYLNRSNKANASEVLKLIANDIIQGYTTPSVIQICIYFLEKEMSARQLSRLFISLLQYVDVVESSKESIVAAFTSNANDFEDAILYYTAMHHNLDYFVTFENKFAKTILSVLPVVTPSQLLKVL